MVRMLWSRSASRMASTAVSRDGQAPSDRGCALPGLRICGDHGSADRCDQVDDVVAELIGNPLRRTGRVVHIVEQCRADHRRLHAEIGDDDGDGEAVGDERVPATAHLAFMPEGSFSVGVFHQGGISLGVVCADDGEQAVERRCHACPRGGA